MAIDTGTTVSEALERLTTPAGALLAALFAVVGTLREIGRQDLARRSIDQLLADVRAYEPANEEMATALRDLEAFLEDAQAELHLALGLDSGTATALWLGAFLAGLVVLAIAVDAFGRDRSTPGELGTDRLGWKVLNLALGWVAYVLLIAVGVAFLILPGVIVALVLLYFPVAIALDGEWFGDAFGSSIAVVREHLGATLLLVLVIVVAYVVAGVASALLGVLLPDTVGAVLAQVADAVAWTFTLALLTSAYTAARDAEERAPDATLTEWTAEDESAGRDGAAESEVAADREGIAEGDETADHDRTADRDRTTDRDRTADRDESADGDGDRTADGD